MTPALQSAIDVAAASSAYVIIVIQQKGGSGKSTITVNLAACLGRSTTLVHGAVGEDEDSPVVAAGIDPQGSLERWADRVPEEKLPFDYVVTRGRLGELPKIKSQPKRRRVLVDTPGFVEVDPDAAWGEDPLGDGRVADALREVLDIADLAIVPITPEWLSWEPVEFTIERILKPRNIKFLVVINLHDPRDGEAQLDKVKAWIDERGYPRMAKPIRKYKIHSHAAEEGQVVTEYKDSGTALRAREDFMDLALCVEQAL
ncbi:ParA family protein [Kitasatospora sp. NPDC051170]|uniref:nucleotide-binding protein n=1 Tax=Kitasatospora sp. NPDC051170 TaxID=3364056 RepID=UPI0037B74F6F